MFSCSNWSVQKALKELNLVSPCTWIVPLITALAQEQRLECSNRLIKRLKNVGPNAKPVLFRDEKFFSIDCKINRQNSRYWTKHKGGDVKFVNKAKKPTGVMVLGVLGSDGKKMPPIFIPQGLKINTKVYQDLLQEEALPWIEQESGGSASNVVWQQDGAPCHTAKTTQN